MAIRPIPSRPRFCLAKTIIEQFYNLATADLAAAEFEKVFAQKQLPDDMKVIELSR